MRYCTNCGNPLNGEKFCTKCGAKVEQVVNQPAAAAASKRGGKGVIIAVGAVVLAVIILILIFTGRGYKRTVNTMMKSVLNGDYEKLISLIPDELVEETAESQYDGDMDELIKDVEDMFEGTLGDVSDTLDSMGISISDIKYEITDEEDYTKEELEDLNEEMQDAGMKKEIKEAKKVEVEISSEVVGKDYNYTVTIDVGKIGRSWYLITS